MPSTRRKSCRNSTADAQRLHLYFKSIYSQRRPFFGVPMGKSINNKAITYIRLKGEKILRFSKQNCSHMVFFYKASNSEAYDWKNWLRSFFLPYAWVQKWSMLGAIFLPYEGSTYSVFRRSIPQNFEEYVVTAPWWKYFMGSAGNSSSFFLSQQTLAVHLGAVTTYSSKFWGILLLKTL